MARYIVSACLAGFRTRHDGTDALSERVRELVASGEAIPICPEQAGGLPTPRLPAEIAGGDGHDVLKAYRAQEHSHRNSKNDEDRRNMRVRVSTGDGVDVTEQFIKGARETLKLAQIVGATKAILKANSPSCGAGSIYDGTFSGNITKGDGVTTALLKEFGIDVKTEDDYD